MKKGLALAWGGILGMCLVATFVVIYMTQAEPVQTGQAINSGKIVSFANDVQLYRKLYVESIPYMLRYSTYYMGATGCGNDEWSESSPTLDDIKINLKNDINNRLTKTVIDGNRRIEFNNIKDLGGNDVDVLELEDYETNFIVSGKKEIKITNSILESTSKSEIIIDETIVLSYFRLATQGRALIDKEQYSINSLWFTPSDSTFSVTSHISECSSIEFFDAIDDTSVSGFTYANIKNIVKVAILCGYKSNPGIGTITNNDLNEINFRIDAILNGTTNSLNSDLSSENINVFITKGTVSKNANIFTINPKVIITDTESNIYLSSEEREVGDSPTDQLRLKFNLKPIKAELKYYDLEAVDIELIGINDPISVKFTVKNNGNLEVSDVKYDMYLGSTKLCGGIISYIAAQGENKFDACADVSQSGTVKIIVDPTSTSLPSGEFLETDENNNEKTKSVTICGNNIKEIGERCDDGNNVDGDGCSSTCTVETATT